MKCGEKFLYLQKQIGDKHLIAFVPARCKSWSCPDCRSIKSKIVKDYIETNFRDEKTYMLSLTFFHVGTALDAWLKLGKCWNLMRTYCVDKYGSFKYVRIVEPHKKGGWPHVHIVLNKNIIDSDIIKKITSWGFGWQMDNSVIDATDAARYVSKYLTKGGFYEDADIMRVSSKCRVVCVSRGMPAMFTARSHWECVKFDMPNTQSKYLCSSILQKLLDLDCTYVVSSPSSGGFIIESNLELSTNWLNDIMDPWVERIAYDFLYDYYPNGLQMALCFDHP